MDNQNFRPVEPPSIQDQYDEEKQKEKEVIHNKMLVVYLQTNSDDTSPETIRQDYQQIQQLLSELVKVIKDNDCVINLFTVTSVDMVDICGAHPQEPGPFEPTVKMYQINFHLRGPIGKLIENLYSIFNRKLYIEVFTLLQYGADKEIFNKDYDEDELPGQQHLFNEENETVEQDD